MDLKFEKFDGTLISWRELFGRAARFATELGPARVRGISHSGHGGRGIITVWYLAAGERAEAVPAAALPLELKFAYERGTLVGWDELFRKVAARADSLQPEQVLGFSHSDSGGDGVVALWYWDASS